MADLLKLFSDAIDDSAEKITIEIDLVSKSPEIDKKKLIYGSPEAVTNLREVRQVCKSN